MSRYPLPAAALIGALSQTIAKDMAQSISRPMPYRRPRRGISTTLRYNATTTDSCFSIPTPSSTG